MSQGESPAVFPRAQPRRLGEWPLGLVLLGVAAGLAVLAFGSFRVGTVLVGASVLAGGALRAVLPARAAGLLVVRSRIVDVITLVVLGGALVALALVVPAPA